MDQQERRSKGEVNEQNVSRLAGGDRGRDSLRQESTEHRKLGLFEREPTV